MNAFRTQAPYHPNRVLICNDDALELAALRRDLRQLLGAEIFSATDGIEAISSLLKNAPDLVLLDMVMPGMDALNILRYLKAIHMPQMPRIVVMLEAGQQALAGAALALGAHLAIEKRELERANLPRMLRQLASGPAPDAAWNAQQEARLYAALLELGVPRHLDGFKYIMESVRLVLCDDHYERNFSKRLYPAVARRYNTTASCVERSIRHAVETAWAHISLSVLQREFGNTIDGDRGKPTNSEFIARMVDKLRHGGEYIPGGD